LAALRVRGRPPETKTGLRSASIPTYEARSATRSAGPQGGLILRALGRANASGRSEQTKFVRERVSPGTPANRVRGGRNFLSMRRKSTQPEHDGRGGAQGYTVRPMPSGECRTTIRWAASRSLPTASATRGNSQGRLSTQVGDAVNFVDSAPVRGACSIIRSTFNGTRRACSCLWLYRDWSSHLTLSGTGSRAVNLNQLAGRPWSLLRAPCPNPFYKKPGRWPTPSPLNRQ